MVAVRGIQQNWLGVQGSQPPGALLCSGNRGGAGAHSQQTRGGGQAGGAEASPLRELGAFGNAWWDWKEAMAGKKGTREHGEMCKNE